MSPGQSASIYLRSSTLPFWAKKIYNEAGDVLTLAGSGPGLSLCLNSSAAAGLSVWSRQMTHNVIPSSVPAQLPWGLSPLRSSMQRRRKGVVGWREQWAPAVVRRHCAEQPVRFLALPPSLPPLHLYCLEMECSRVPGGVGWTTQGCGVTHWGAVTLPCPSMT